MMKPERGQLLTSHPRVRGARISGRFSIHKEQINFFLGNRRDGGGLGAPSWNEVGRCGGGKLLSQFLCCQWKRGCGSSFMLSRRLTYGEGDRGTCQIWDAYDQGHHNVSAVLNKQDSGDVIINPLGLCLPLCFFHGASLAFYWIKMRASHHISSVIFINKNPSVSD